jgi:hypothetical protein
MNWKSASAWIAASVSLAALIFGVWNSRKIQTLSISIDGRLTELLIATSTAAHAAGKEEQRAETIGSNA